MSSELRPGTIVQWVVAGPGPDCDLALVIKFYGAGKHRIRFKVWGQGEWYEEDVSNELWPEPRYPNQWDERTADMLRQEWVRLKELGDAP